MSNFDRGHRTSLHLFEYPFGDSRERGPALLGLAQTYEKSRCACSRPGAARPPGRGAGVRLHPAAALAREFLGEMTHILNALFTALLQRQSPYASVIAAILEAAGEKPRPCHLAPSRTWTRLGCA